MNNQALRYYMHDGPSAFRFELAGHLDRDSALRLEQDWLTASSVIGHRSLIVDITFVTGADAEARVLFSRWYRAGASIVANSGESRALAESIVGGPLPPTSAAAASSGRTWMPFRGSFAAITFGLLLFALLFPTGVGAADLKPETIGAWNNYVQTVNASLRERISAGGKFLWTFEDPARAAKVRSGEIVVAPVPGRAPKRVPGGLIHHWIGAAFLPGRVIDDVVEVTRDYNRYKDFYAPVVVGSQVVSRSGRDDRFSMLLLNNAFLFKTALDADYSSTNVWLDSHRFYSISHTTRVQEIHDFGEPDEARLPEGQGAGYIWKLYSVVRMEERDSGVYVELEAVALSRDIPLAARLLVDPIVRRVSRHSLATSLRQTEDALRGEVAKTSPAVGGTSNAGQLPDFSAAFAEKFPSFISVH